MSVDITELSATLLRAKLVNGELSLPDALSCFLRKIEEQDSNYHCFLHVDREGLEQQVNHLQQEPQAKALPLFGIPVVIPDSLHLYNTPTTFGSKLLENWIAKEDDLAVACLKQAGALVLGKTNMSEFSISYETRNALIPPTRNPLNPKFSPGGPAGGTGAAVAAGFAPCALMNDVTGGLRLTASFCGLIGLMPTRKAWPLHYKHLLTYTDHQFFRKGIIARCIEDVALFFDLLMTHEEHVGISSCALRGKSLLDTLEPAEKGMRIAYSEDLGYVTVDPEVRKVVKNAAKKLEEMGHVVEKIESGISPDCYRHMRHMLSADRAGVLLELLEERGLTEESLTAASRTTLEEGDRVTGIQYSWGTAATKWLQKHMEELFSHYDLFLVPTAPSAPYPVGEIHKAEVGVTAQQIEQIPLLTAPFNMSGNPVLTVPAGVSRFGLPIGVQFVGRSFDEARLLNIGKHFLG